ncbi:hypothetical protein EVG20_g9776 [Dentipellis fragilis]|uniref:Uncharacterized protein n=1 Tax=Dentipellis fragilis TaxID=205917 RepID=A0A4Y9XW02_9AGAM|nr:hypothetical protein EVG20_g9776 [Dentipellis fragilis]
MAATCGEQRSDEGVQRRTPRQPGTLSRLDSTQQQLLQNRTQDLASTPVSQANLADVVLVNGSMATSPPVTLAPADEVGEIDQFVVVDGIPKERGRPQHAGVTLEMTSILVCPTGISVVSEPDHHDKHHVVGVPNEGLNSSFVNPCVDVLGIPELYEH